ncbi:sensor histidine kinase [Brevibacillus formosus]|uniref:sensor histidine kinase n=1 Tax=Brevibacillus formosus TaxID=54913 RepID=UPI003F1CABBD
MKPLKRFILSFIYLTALAIPGILLRLYKFNLSEKWPKTRQERLLTPSLLLSGAATFVLIIMITSSAYMSGVVPAAVVPPTTNTLHFQLLTLAFAVVTTVLFWQYMRATVKQAEAATEAPYLNYLLDLAVAASSIRHDANNHVVTIKNLHILGRTDEALAYCLGLIDQTDEVTAALENIQNTILAAVLVGKKSEFKVDSVPLQILISPEASQLPNWKDIDTVAVISNLLDNAFRATKHLKVPDRSIKLEWKTEGRTEVIIVENTGRSIPAEDLPHLFEFGFSKAGGQGVGLANVQRIVKKYRGKIDVYSQDGITRFTITAPVK